jgi:hypothetical protein
VKNKILAICIISMFLLTGTSIVTATNRTTTVKPVNTNSDNNEGNGIRIKVYIYPLLARYHYLECDIESKNISHMLDGTFTIKLTYKDNELNFYREEGGFYSSYGTGIYSNISFSRPVKGTLCVDFTGSGKDDGLHESITLSVIIFKTKPYTWAYTPW